MTTSAAAAVRHHPHAMLPLLSPFNHHHLLTSPRLAPRDDDFAHFPPLSTLLSMCIAEYSFQQERVAHRTDSGSYVSNHAVRKLPATAPYFKVSPRPAHLLPHTHQVHPQSIQPVARVPILCTLSSACAIHCAARSSRCLLALRHSACTTIPIHPLPVCAPPPPRPMQLPTCCLPVPPVYDHARPPVRSAL